MIRVLCTIPYSPSQKMWPDACHVPPGTPLGPFGHALLTALTRNTGDNEDWRSVNWQAPLRQGQLELIASRLDSAARAHGLRADASVKFFGWSYKGEAGERAPCFTVTIDCEQMGIDVCAANSNPGRFYWRWRHERELSSDEKQSPPGAESWHARSGYTRKVPNELREDEVIMLLCEPSTREQRAVAHHPGYDAGFDDMFG
jgi:hypothetical protein